MSSKKNRQKKDSEAGKESLGIGFVIIMCIMPFFFAFMGVAGTNEVEPLKSILIAACGLFLIGVTIFAVLEKIGKINYTMEMDHYVFLFTIAYSLFLLNIPSLYLMRGEPFWFLLLLFVFISPFAMNIWQGYAYNNNKGLERLGRFTKIFYRMIAAISIPSFIVFVIATLGYNRFRARIEGFAPPAVVAFGDKYGHEIIWVSFTLFMTAIFGMGLFNLYNRMIYPKWQKIHGPATVKRKSKTNHHKSSQA